jgi:hypothetical protein
MSSWRFKDFGHQRDSVGRFEVWGYHQNYGVDYCKVVCYCQTDAGIKWAMQTYHDIAISNLKGPDFKLELNMQVKKSKIAGPNFGRSEVSAIFGMKPEAIAIALANTTTPPESEDLIIKPGTISVGPCAWRTQEGMYVKVRFNGFSVPFFFTKDEFLPTPTQKAIAKEVGGASGEAAFKVLVDNKDMLHKRALERPLNLSDIADYAQHNVKIMKGDGKGRYYSATPAEISDPSSELVTVFNYGYSAAFAVINDEVFKVKGFVNGFNIFHNRSTDDPQPTETHTYNLDYNWGDQLIKGYLRRIDCVPLDPEDQFVREKIGRSLKAKL